MRRRTATVVGGVVLMISLVGSALSAGTAGATSSGAIGPDQTFVGLVNGEATGATIEVACSQAVRPGQTGSPASGQTIGVRSPAPSTVPGGATGARGRTIVARFLTSSATTLPGVTFSHYGTKPLPAALQLPCIGRGTLVFSPAPVGSGARGETITVSFVPPCPEPCAGGRAGGRREG